jgi:LmbE family N-acetylglucosaminyl deacetylase
LLDENARQDLRVALFADVGRAGMTSPPRLLVTVAHPDDETFGTGSLIASAAERSARVTVLCATRGEAGEAHGVPAGADLAAVREAELRAAGAVLGVDRFVLLEFGDSGMTGDLPVGALAAAPLDEVAGAVRAVIDDVAPDVVVTLDPDHGDGHRDHSAIGRATLQACRDFPEVRAYVWTVTRSLLADWLEYLGQVRPGSAHLELDHQGVGRTDEDITTFLDVKHLRDVRLRAAALHRSQVFPFANMPDDLLSEFLDTDRLVRMQPPWTGGDPERSLF